MGATANRRDIANGMRTFSDRMDVKSHKLHAPLRQDVAANPDLVAKRRCAEERNLQRDLAGEDIK